jgi:CHAD domain-containing protein
MKLGSVVSTALSAAIEQLVRSESRLRLDPHADAVHDVRVAVRRLSSLVRTFAPVLDPAPSPALLAPLRRLSDALSAARDADVVLASASELAASLPDGGRERAEELLGLLRDRRAASYGALLNLLDTRPHRAFLDGLRGAGATRAVDVADARMGRAVARLMRPLWKRAHATVCGAGRPPSNRDLHRIRLRVKHLRYAAAALAPLDGRRAARFGRRAAALQEQLGGHHDAVITEDAVKALCPSLRDAPVAAELAGLARARARLRRRHWRAHWKSLVRAVWW